MYKGDHESNLVLKLIRSAILDLEYNHVALSLSPQTSPASTDPNESSHKQHSAQIRDKVNIPVCRVQWPQLAEFSSPVQQPPVFYSIDQTQPTRWMQAEIQKWCTARLNTLCQGWCKTMDSTLVSMRWKKPDLCYWPVLPIWLHPSHRCQSRIHL